MAQTSNQKLFDSALQHYIAVRAFTAGETRRALRQLEKADRAFTLLLREALSSLGSKPDLQSESFRGILKRLQEARSEALRELRSTIRSSLGGLQVTEIQAELRAIEQAIPFDFELAIPVSAETVSSQIIQGKSLAQWFNELQVSDRSRIEAAIRLGLTQGEAIGQIVARISGTRAGNFVDGELALTRRNAETIVRTSANHIANAAREEVWEANSDIILALRWTSVLDGRTSAICRSRDGKLAPIGGKPLPAGSEPLDPPGARPPAHPNCRSIMVAVLSPEGVVGTRPFVRDTRRRREREIDFREIARREGRSIQEVRRQWAEENIGQVPARTTYNEWLRQQPASFQDDVLGPSRGRLFRQEDLELDQFVDRSGRELTLEQLQELVPA